MEVCPLLYLNLPVVYQGLISTLLSVAPQHINGRGERGRREGMTQGCCRPCLPTTCLLLFLKSNLHGREGFLWWCGFFILLFCVAPPPSRQLQSSLTIFWQAGYDEQERRDTHTCCSSFTLMQGLLHLIIP